MFKILKQWFNRYFSDPEAVLLFFILVLGFGLVIFFGGILAPVLVGIVFAYLLDWMVLVLESWKLPRYPAVLVVFLGFLTLLFLSIFTLVPIFGHQLSALFEELPQMINKAQGGLSWLSDHFPSYFSEDQLNALIDSFGEDIRKWAKELLTASLASITRLIVWMVYLILVPLLVFFFLKDRELLTNWFASFLPYKRSILRKVSIEVNQQIGNYIRGKVVEIVIVGFFTYMVFWYYGLHYGILLASIVGLSCLIPYVGGVVITIPVVIVAYLQFGWHADLGYMLIFYLIVQVLDANLLVPLLFSEAVNLHPVAIIVATLFFGGIWGFWGVFFAIPLATLAKAVLSAWPTHKNSG